MSAMNSDILHLFNRPREPVYVPKGEKKVAFDIPDDYLPEKYQPVAREVKDHFASMTVNKIPVCPISIPDLSVPLELKRCEIFSLFIPHHRKMAARLIKIFMDRKTYKDFLSTAVYCRDRINSNMFIYALSVAILHRPDTKNLSLPPLVEVFPDKFVNSANIASTKEEANLVPARFRRPVDISDVHTASDLDIEHRVAYFRGDLGINLHHWHWHLVYPTDGDRAIVNKDRRGELFYYMHQQIIARYNFERLSNRLSRVKRFTNWQEPIPEGYFPKMDCVMSNRTLPGRISGATLRDVDRPDNTMSFDIQDMQRFRDRILGAIHAGSIIDDCGNSIKLTEFDGIDILGNILEATILSPNKSFYGDLHNYGHLAISSCHDPDYRYLECLGVMADPATAMRDPFFYRWHAFVDCVFQEWKKTLPPYTPEQLGFEGVQVTDVQIVTPNQPTNVLSTFWRQSDVDLSRGLDYTPSGAILIRFTHLDHAAYVYRISVNNRGRARMGTVRIFIAPNQDERGLPFALRDQRRLMVEMDKFTVNLCRGNNFFERSSVESSVTIPFERTFSNLGKDESSVDEPFCGCGWPQHMLIPKGNKEGFPADLFVMVSNFAGDRIDQDLDTCSKNGASYCGLKDKKYPDARSMGYPFDRLPRDEINTLSAFATGNMRAVGVTIRFNDTVMPPR